MGHLDKKGYHFGWVGEPILIGAALIAAGLLLTPSLLADRMSPDGVFGDGFLGRITLAEICRWGALLSGGFLVLCGILKWSGWSPAFKVEETLEERAIAPATQPRRVVIILFAFLALALLNKTAQYTLSGKWKQVVGYEYYWIAESLAEGQGYSLPADHRWYFYDFKSSYPSDQYYPTALEEPLYPVVLGLAFRGLGIYGHLAVLYLNVIALYLTGILMYLLARKIFGSRAGVIVSVALLTWWWFEVSWLTLGAFSPATFGGLAITGSVYALLWSLEKPSVKRGLVVGAVLAVSCLTLAAGVLLIPLAILFTIFWKRPLRPVAWKPAAAIAVAAGVIMLPWIVRNFVVFGTVIPVRTGFGLALHQSNPILAATFADAGHACVEELGPLWRAKDPKDAIVQVRHSQAKRLAMYKRGYDCIALHAPPGYAGFNEAQRDKVYLKESIAFIRDNPGLFLKMTRYRIQAFLVGWNPRHTLVTLLAIVGALLSWRNRYCWILIAVVAAYTFTFSLATPLMYRYRYPIEPTFFVLAGAIPVVLLSLLRTLSGRIGDLRGAEGDHRS